MTKKSKHFLNIIKLQRVWSSHKLIQAFSLMRGKRSVVIFQRVKSNVLWGNYLTKEAAILADQIKRGEWVWRFKKIFFGIFGYHTWSHLTLKRYIYNYFQIIKYFFKNFVILGCVCWPEKQNVIFRKEIEWWRTPY